MMDLPFLFFPGGSDGKASAYNEGDLGSILGSGRSPGEGNGNPLQYSCLENSRQKDQVQYMSSRDEYFFKEIEENLEPDKGAETI